MTTRGSAGPDLFGPTLLFSIVLHGIVKAIARRVIFWADSFSDLSHGA